MPGLTVQLYMFNIDYDYSFYRTIINISSDEADVSDPYFILPVFCNDDGVCLKSQLHWVHLVGVHLWCPSCPTAHDTRS